MSNIKVELIHDEFSYQVKMIFFIDEMKFYIIF